MNAKLNKISSVITIGLVAGFFSTGNAFATESEHSAYQLAWQQTAAQEQSTAVGAKKGAGQQVDWTSDETKNSVYHLAAGARSGSTSRYDSSAAHSGSGRYCALPSGETRYSIYDLNRPC